MKTSPLRIVCMTDFSEPARQAAMVAAVLAARGGAVLILVHALNLGPALLSRAAQQKVASKAADAQLKAEIRRLKEHGARIEAVVLDEGWAAEALLAYIKAEVPTFIVASSRRKSALDRWALGSVSDEIAQHAPCPTLVVRNPGPLIDWGQGKSTLKVFAALDFGACSESVLHWIRQLQQFGACQLTACHVNWRREEGPLAAVRVLGPNAKNPARVQAKLERDLRKSVSDIAGIDDATIIVKASWGSPDALLIEIAGEAGADLIVVGTHQRHGLGWLWHGSISRNLVHHAPMSVACVPKTVAGDPKAAHVPHFRRVLVTTDLSALGNAAVPWASAALPSGGVVELMHVIAPGPLGGNKGKHQMDKAREQLKALIPAETERLGIRTELVVVADRDPAAAICAESERFGADVVCLSSHGRSGMSKMLLGSVAESVMEQSRRPVLIVRPPN